MTLSGHHPGQAKKWKLAAWRERVPATVKTRAPLTTGIPMPVFGAISGTVSRKVLPLVTSMGRNGHCCTRLWQRDSEAGPDHVLPGEDAEGRAQAFFGSEQ
jgi:hypothetical protein